MTVRSCQRYFCTVLFHVVASRQVNTHLKPDQPQFTASAIRCLNTSIKFRGAHHPKNIVYSLNCDYIHVYGASLSNFMTHSSIAERAETISYPLPAAEEGEHTQTSPHWRVCAAAVRLTRCPGQVWPLHCHCLVPFNSLLAGWATADFFFLKTLQIE